MDKIKLTKEELAALDLLISNAETSAEGFLPEATWTAAAREIAKAVAREAVFEAARQAVEKVVEKVVGRNTPLDLSNTSDLDLLTKSITEQLSKRTSLEQLKEIRKNIELK